MKPFLQRFGSLVLGVLHGFDRLRLRGSKRLLCNPGGVFSFLAQVRVPLKDYKTYAKETTLALCQAIETDAKRAGLYHYLNNGHESEEETALRLAAEQGRQQGLIAVLGCVEPCQVVRVRGNEETKKLELRIEPGKCLHYYHYYRDADYGLRYTRLQSWSPFTMHVGLNGRDWLARQMTEAGLGYRQKDNCFTWVEDWEAAQRLLDEQLTTDWASLLDGRAARSHPRLSRLVVPPVPYYWSVQEGGYATDIAFRTPEDLQRLYPRLVQYATGPLQSTDVLRLLGYRVTKGRRAASRSGRRGGDHDQGAGGRDVCQASGAEQRAEDVRQVRAGAAAGGPADRRPGFRGVPDARREHGRADGILGAAQGGGGHASPRRGRRPDQ
jgi:hypothetical protein